MSKQLTFLDVQELGLQGDGPNPLIASPVRERVIALAQDRSHFVDEEAWVWGPSSQQELDAPGLRRPSSDSVAD